MTHVKGAVTQIRNRSITHPPQEGEVVGDTVVISVVMTTT